MSSSVSNVSSALGESVPRAPTPFISAWSDWGTVHANDSGRRRAVKIKVSSVKADSMAMSTGGGGPYADDFGLTETGSNENQSPNADQKDDSFVRLLIRYAISRSSATSSGIEETKGGEDSWMRVRRSGPKSSGKYTCPGIYLVDRK